MLRVKSPQDLGAGLLFIFIGCVGLYFGKDLTYGSARSMGPGYFPVWLSWIINIMGAICIVRSVIFDGDPIGKIPIRPIAWVSAGVLLFGYMIEHVKLELALIILALLATQSRRQSDLAQKIVLAFALVFGIAVISTNFAAFAFLKPVGELILKFAPWLTLALFVITGAITWGERDARQTVILSAGMAIAAVLVFVVILGQAMPTYSADIFSSVFSKIGSIFTGSAGR